MQIDTSVANSNGYFKDPVTKQDLSASMPRVIKAGIEDSGKFIWPQVQVSNGTVVKIVYKYFTEEEKQIYKQYRALGKSKVHVSVPVVKEQVVNVPSSKGHSQVKYVQTANERSKVGYDSAAACSAPSAALIKECEMIGTEQIAGLTYAKLIKGNPNKIYYVPRALVKEAV